MSLAEVSLFRVLGEDAAHRSFIRRWLGTQGVPARRIDTVEPPADKSGGIHFVLARCREVVQQAMERNKRVKTRVIIAMDADEATIEARRERIQKAIAGEDGLDASAITFILVPKRHIETWVHTLGPSQAKVDEISDYKPKDFAAIKAAAAALVRANAAPVDPPSLVDGYNELQRLKNGD